MEIKLSDNFTLTNLKTYPNKFEETISLIEKAFDYNPSNKFEVDFYPLINKTNFENNIIIIDNNSLKVIAHTGIQERVLAYQDKTTSVGLIGGIAVDREMRGQGLFKILFNYIIDTYTNDFSMLILWSDLNKLYEKFGFAQAGIQYQSGNNNLSPKIKELFKKTTWELLSPDEFKSLKALFNKQENNITLLRDDHDWENIKKITSVDLYIKNNEQTISSYFLINKGQDLTNIIHEYYLEKSIDIRLRNDFFNCKVWHSTPFHKNELSLYVGLFKIANPNLFSNFIAEFYNLNIKIIKFDNNNIKISLDNVLHDFSTTDFFQTFLGPNKDELIKNIPNIIFYGVDSV